jgi:hypothetical protein
MNRETKNVPSSLAVRVRRLQDVTVRAVAARERLPQPLFWSVFRAELNEIKLRKARERAAAAALGIIDL